MQLYGIEVEPYPQFTTVLKFRLGGPDPLGMLARSCLTVSAQPVTDDPWLYVHHQTTAMPTHPLTANAGTTSPWVSPTCTRYDVQSRVCRALKHAKEAVIDNIDQRSGFGFELTFRLVKGAEQQAPVWPYNMMQVLGGDRWDCSVSRCSCSELGPICF